MAMRRIIIGDLHGCFSELQDLLAHFNYAPTDQIISVGDVCGKGPSPLECLSYLHSQNAKVVLGNHDVYHLSRFQKGLPNCLNDKMAQWMNTWPLYIEEKDFFVVHAGFDPRSSTPSTQDPQLLYTIRHWDGKGVELNNETDPAWYECCTPSKMVVFGHWAKRGLIDLPHFKGLDTGCVYGKKLTGYCPEENKFYQVPAQNTYVRIKGS